MLIESKVGDVTVLVTPDNIATFLNYKRPSPEACTFPEANWMVTLDTVIETITEDPRTFDHGFARNTSRGVKLHYCLKNKVASYNLDPFSREKTPSKSDGDLIYVLGSSLQVCD